MYHGIVPDDYPIDAWTLVRESEFRKQMSHLKKYYKVISIEEAINQINHPLNGGKPRVVITFDDGYENNYSIAYPIIKAFNFPATIFVATAFIDSPELFWFDKVIYDIQSTQCQILDLSAHNLDIHYFGSTEKSKRWDAIECLLSRLKAEEPSPRKKIVDEIRTRLSPKFEQIGMLFPLKSQQIVDMSGEGLIEFGSHTHSHEILTQLNTDEVRETVKASIEAIFELTGEEVRYFSYPNGEFKNDTIKVLKEARLNAAFTTTNGFWNTNVRPYEIPRLGVGGYDYIEIFAGALSGVKAAISSPKKWFLRR